MALVMFINKFGGNEVHTMEHIPRKGDVVPLFYIPHPKVSQVVWFPEKVLPDIEITGVDVLITLD